MIHCGKWKLPWQDSDGESRPQDPGSARTHFAHFGNKSSGLHVHIPSFTDFSFSRCWNVMFLHAVQKFTQWALHHSNVYVFVGLPNCIYLFCFWLLILGLDGIVGLMFVDRAGIKYHILCHALQTTVHCAKLCTHEKYYNKIPRSTARCWRQWACAAGWLSNSAILSWFIPHHCIFWPGKGTRLMIITLLSRHYGFFFVPISLGMPAAPVPFQYTVCVRSCGWDFPVRAVHSTGFLSKLVIR